MKKFLIAAVAAFMATFAVAGGNIAPVEPIEKAPVTKDLYVGIGLTAYNNYENGDKDFFDDASESEISGGFDVKAGYTFYRVKDISVSVEGQAGTSLWGFLNGYDGSPSTYNYGVYIKPEYDITKEISAYALLGYARAVIDVDGDKEGTSGFAYGIGGAYAINDSVSVYTEYVMLPAFSGGSLDDVNNDKTVLGIAYNW
jgi:opacity protein-like surface antigen